MKAGGPRRSIHCAATGDAWEGMNTDLAGFMAPLAGRLPLSKARATVLGAGGAARSVAVGLAGAGATVTLAARRR